MKIYFYTRIYFRRKLSQNFKFLGNFTLKEDQNSKGLTIDVRVYFRHKIVSKFQIFRKLYTKRRPKCELLVKNEFLAFWFDNIFSYTTIKIYFYTRIYFRPKLSQNFKFLSNFAPKEDQNVKWLSIKSGINCLPRVRQQLDSLTTRKDLLPKTDGRCHTKNAHNQHTIALT